MERKITNILLLIVVLLEIFIISQINTNKFDVDQDNEVTARDYIIIKEYIMNEENN